MKALIYIASPYSIGDKCLNVQRQIKVAHSLMDCGYAPVWPLSSHYLEMFRSRPYDEWMTLDYELIRRCDALLRLPGESKGADLEVAYARELGMPVFYSINGMLEDAFEGTERRTSQDTWSLVSTFASSAIIVVLALILALSGVYHLVMGGQCGDYIKSRKGDGWQGYYGGD